MIQFANRRKSKSEITKAYHEKYRDDPNAWIKEFLKVDLWSIQREIVDSVFSRRKTVVRSCNSSGKTFVSACTALAFLYTRAPSKVITTAPQWTQVSQLLWRDIATLFKRQLKRRGFPGNILQTRLDVQDDWFAIGLSPKDDVNIQGYHQKHILVIVDECPGVRPEIIAALDSLTASGDAHTLWIGNPGDPAGHFYDAFSSENFKHFDISVFDTPNFTDEKWAGRGKVDLANHMWEKERREEWGEDSGDYARFVLGQFPREGTDQIISMALAEAARKNKVVKHPNSKTFMGVDVAGSGKNSTVYIIVGGNQMYFIEGNAGQTRTTEIVGRCMQLWKEHNIDEIRVDGIGMGKGVVDQLFEQGAPVIDVIASERTTLHEPLKYFNKRAELWFGMRDWLEYGQIPDDKKLIRDLIAPKRIIKSDGLVRVESKQDMASRINRSPDYADAAMMAVAGNAGPLIGTVPPAFAISSRMDNDTFNRKHDLFVDMYIR